MSLTKIRLILCLMALVYAISAQNWNIQIIVEDDECIDQYTYFGENFLASDELDSFDQVNWNPGITPWVDSYFPHPEWIPGGGNYSADIRSSNLIEKNWITIIGSNNSSAHNCMVSWFNSNTIPEYYNCFINYDNQTVNIQETEEIFLNMEDYVEFEIYTQFKPFIFTSLDSLQLYNNIQHQLNLNQIFSYYGSLNITFGFEENLLLQQAILDSLYFVTPIVNQSQITDIKVYAQTSLDSIDSVIEAGINIYYYGDLDFNDEIEAFDASLILQHIVYLNMLPQSELMRADLDGNEYIDAYDSSLILQFVAGIIEEFPITN